MSAGLVAGPIHELRFHPNGTDVALNARCIIRMKNTAGSALSRFDELGLITVFDAGLVYDSLRLVLLAPFVWDGTNNIVVDIAQESSDDFLPVSLGGFTGPLPGWRCRRSVLMMP